MPTTELLPIAVFLLSFWRDPRKFRTGLYLLAALIWATLSIAGWASGALTEWDELAGAFLLLGLILVGLAAVVGFAGFLIVTGITMVRREGFGLSRVLGLGLGLVLLAYVALVLAVVYTDSLRLFTWLLLLGVPAVYLGFAFVAFLIYGALYPALMARWGGPVAAVVVLGSGLIEGMVPPLLAARLRRGRQLFEKASAEDAQVRLVTSGGQGADEPVAEAVAMAHYLVADGVPAEAVLVEDRSRNTQENLANTAELLRSEGLSGPVAVVTSDFHAFRAALLMRKAGLAGYSVGAPTARYYWPAAVIREFVAVLVDHRWLNAVLLGLSLLPLVYALVGLAFG